MLKLVIDEIELFDEETSEFQYLQGETLLLEHSLLSLSKWESKFQKPFLSSKDKTVEETLEYFKMMVLTPNFDSNIYERINQRHLDQINEYVESTQSATTFGSMPETKGRGEIITSELIYYWMVAFSIPFECQEWHLNRLFSLIRICNIKNGKPKKMSKSELAQRNRMLNEQRRAQFNTSG